MSWNKEQYVNAIGFIKVHISRIENSSKIIFDKNSTEKERNAAKAESEEAVLKIYKLLNTVSAKEEYVPVKETYSDQDLVTMKII